MYDLNEIDPGFKGKKTEWITPDTLHKKNVLILFYLKQDQLMY